LLSEEASGHEEKSRVGSEGVAVHLVQVALREDGQRHVGVDDDDADWLRVSYRASSERLEVSEVGREDVS
jgi:hypothetical protein